MRSHTKGSARARRREPVANAEGSLGKIKIQFIKRRMWFPQHNADPGKTECNAVAKNSALEKIF